MGNLKAEFRLANPQFSEVQPHGSETVLFNQALRDFAEILERADQAANGKSDARLIFTIDHDPDYIGRGDFDMLNVHSREGGGRVLTLCHNQWLGTDPLNASCALYRPLRDAQISYLHSATAHDVKFYIPENVGRWSYYNLGSTDLRDFVLENLAPHIAGMSIAIDAPTFLPSREDCMQKLPGPLFGKPPAPGN